MRARLLVLVVGITSMSACGGGTFAARDSTAGSGGSAETGGEGGGGVPGHGGSATGGTASDPCEGLTCGSACSGCSSAAGCQCDQTGQCLAGPADCPCISARDCPVTDSCQMCWDQSCVSSTADCVQGKCVVTRGVCPPNPCEGMVCGGNCELACSPNTVCQIGFCDAAGACVATEPRCPCDPVTPCAQPVQAACVACPNTTVCQGAVCYHGQCELTSLRCPCEPMRAVASGDCTMVIGWQWNGAECVALSGCGCTGVDCPSLYPDLTTCKDKQARCAVPVAS
jgi:hypothetical protein